MFIAATTIAIAFVVLFWLVARRGGTARAAGHRRVGAALLAFAMVTVLLMVGSSAQAAIVPTVPLGTAANYSVLGGSTVTNTGPSVLHLGLGLSPGTSATGFPPGLVLGTTQIATAAAAQAKLDLTAAYVNAAGRSIDTTTTAALGGLILQPGVYAGPAKSPLGLTGTLTLDAGGNPYAVFIFQTDSTLTTASSSRVTLINGAQACNVFWQVGSSATLGTGSVFVGNILAQESITVTTGVTVQGRALAQTYAVTLDTDTFTVPPCDMTSPYGHIVVRKEVGPAGAPAASFTFDPSWGANFDLAGGGQVDSGSLAAGVYSVAEVEPLPAGWSSTSAVCDDRSSASAIGVSPGETVTCTFTNTFTEQAGPTGSLTVVKATTPAGGAGFSFDAGVLGTFSLDDAGSEVFTGLAAGAYTVTETPAEGWEFEDVVCTTVPGAAVDYQVVGAGAAVNLAEGQAVTCTFTNTFTEQPGPTGSLTVIKRTVPAGGAGFSFDAGVLGTFSLDDAGSEVFTGLAAGAYTVTEIPAEGWEFAQVECTAADYLVEGASVAVNLAEGEAVVCTFTNGALPYTGAQPLTLPLALAGLAALLMGLALTVWSLMREADRS
ncbi:MAG TPA: ice-binding family protein [Acidimicrobiia bacterium]|nr:ice-binding family protein [Acidimicrobiia bacterium]